MQLPYIRVRSIHEPSEIPLSSAPIPAVLYHFRRHGPAGHQARVQQRDELSWRRPKDAEKYIRYQR